MALRFRINRYNWLGQKLLVQNEYGEVSLLKQHLTSDIHSGFRLDEDPSAEVTNWPTSDHLNYVYAVTLMRTSSRLDEVIYALQHMSFDRNSQYFLLLCQSLLYIGNYDSVVALCKQVFNKEIGANFESSCLIDDETSTSVATGSGTNQNAPIDSLLNRQESFELGKVMSSIRANHLLNEPRIWFIFAKALEYQLQYRDASFSYRVATQLASRGQLPHYAENSGDEKSQVSMNDYYLSHLKYAELSFLKKGDFKSAIQLLLQASSTFPKNYSLTPMLALLVSAQSNTNNSSYVKAIELNAALEAHSSSSRNPSDIYNRLAAKCLQQQTRLNPLSVDYVPAADAGDENRSSLGYLLIKSYIITNSLVQNPELSGYLFTGGLNSTQKSLPISALEQGLLNQVDKLIEALRCSHNDCWDCASLWNNLGLCYLMKKRFIACITCFVKALHLNPLDWRINYNLSLACLHVGLISKALVNALAARSIYTSRVRSKTLRGFGRENNEDESSQLITTLTAICFDKLNIFNESRRFYIEAIRPRKNSHSSTPVLPLVNYLIFLDRNSSPDDEEQGKIKLHLLDQLEQSWLQRNQGDPQFSPFLLNIAREIGERTLTGSHRTLAWAKHQQA